MSFVIDKITNMGIYKGDKLIMEFIDRDRNRGFEVVKDEYRKTQEKLNFQKKVLQKQWHMIFLLMMIML